MASLAVQNPYLSCPTTPTLYVFPVEDPRASSVLPEVGVMSVFLGQRTRYFLPIVFSLSWVALSLSLSVRPPVLPTRPLLPVLQLLLPLHLQLMTKLPSS